MYLYEQLREVHLEPTTRCNAACPQCPRNLSGGAVNPALPLTELSLDDVRRIFPRDFVSQLRKMYACGNYGDPMVARDIVDIFRFFREANPKMELGMFTNGSGRTRAFWAELASIVSYVRFSIDGLEDTNHLYRRNTEWARIMESVDAFVSAGGRAEWDFILFRHNEHQVDEARALAEKLGFKRFFVKKTSRFFSPAGVRSKQVIDRRGEPAYTLEPPRDPALHNAAVVRLAQVDDYARYQAEADIACKAAAHKRIYVSAEGHVFPCCWMGALHPPNRAPESTQVWELMRALPDGKASLDARLRPLRDIVDSAFFQTMIPAGWQKKSIADGRLEPCVRACGSHDTHGAQYGASLL